MKHTHQPDKPQANQWGNPDPAKNINMPEMYAARERLAGEAGIQFVPEDIRIINHLNLTQGTRQPTEDLLTDMLPNIHSPGAVMWDVPVEMVVHLVAIGGSGTTPARVNLAQFIAAWDSDDEEFIRNAFGWTKLQMEHYYTELDGFLGR